MPSSCDEKIDNCMSYVPSKEASNLFLSLFMLSAATLFIGSLGCALGYNIGDHNIDDRYTGCYIGSGIGNHPVK